MGFSKIKTVVFVLLLIFLTPFLVLSLKMYAQTETPTPTQSPQDSQSQNENKTKDLQKLIDELQKKIGDLQGQKKTLSSQIGVMDNQIKLTQLRINATKTEIAVLEDDIQLATKKISNLESTLNALTKILVKRIVATYEAGTVTPLHTLLSFGAINDYFTRSNYLKIVQNHDKELVYETQQAKIDYTNQKNIFENKKKKVEALRKQLEVYTAQIEQEKKGKQQLLDITKNDEMRYQELLAKARAEYQAILGIVAGKGTETEVGGIKEGDQIATIISGSSACSTGTHLHFEVDNNGSHTNPTGYLSPKDVDWDLCGWYGCDGNFSFSGSWPWPINGKPRITQGYGMTAYARSGAYGGGPHTGIDMVSDDLAVKAVKDGILYRGSIPCGGGTLRYVKVHQKDDSLDTFYLHINYIL